MSLILWKDSEISSNMFYLDWGEWRKMTFPSFSFEIFNFCPIEQSGASSVTRSGDLLDFGKLFKAFGNDKFAQISHILRQFM